MIARTRHGESGFSLIEALVSLAIFAAIGLAGFAMIEGVVRVRDRADGRLERLGAVERALLVMTADFEQAAPGRFAAEDGAVTLRRHGAPASRGFIVTYALEEDALVRQLSADAATPVRQRLLEDVAALRWRFYLPEAGWRETWPPQGGAPPVAPRAVAAELTLSPEGGGLAGRVRRLMALPSLEAW